MHITEALFTIFRTKNKNDCKLEMKGIKTKQ